MFRNVLAAALRNLARNPLYAAISIASLAVGMAAAILTGLYIRDETAFDGAIPGVDKVYVVVSDYRIGTSKPKIVDNTVPPIGPDLKLDFREALHTARTTQSVSGVRHGDVAATEAIAWSDPDLFVLLHAPVVAGDPVAALHSPAGAVITRAIARKYFGRDAPIGQTLEVNGAESFRVDAVLEDPPANTNLSQPIWLSNLSAASPMHRIEAAFRPHLSYGSCCRTYVEVADAAALGRIRAGLSDFFVRRLGYPGDRLRSGATVHLDLVPLARLHLYPLNGFSAFGRGVPQGSWAMVWTLALVASAVLAVGAINFVNLMTARAARRAVEVGVRKTAGASRTDLVWQFIGEAAVYALIAWVFAVSAVELALPAARSILARPLPFWDGRDLLPLAASFALALGMGALAGVYPALVQSGFRPAAVLKGVLPPTAGSALVRAALTTLQFAALIGLGVAVLVISRQTHFTLNEGLNVDKANIVNMDVGQPRRPDLPASVRPTPPCRTAFADEVRALPGVAGAACAAAVTFDSGDLTTSLPRPDGATLAALRSPVDFGFFELFGKAPVAGRLFSRRHPEDDTPWEGPAPPAPRTAVINQMMVRALGFASPAAAVGQTFKASGMGPGPGPAQIGIIGVVPDFAFDLLDLGKWPRFYVVEPNAMATLSIKLKPGDQAATLRAIDVLWARSGAVIPPSHRFVDDYVQAFYLATIQQGYMLDALCAVAVFLAALGLFGLAAFTAERRTKEIGVRKAMGASSGEIVRLLLWSFTRPVLWANLIAWPVAWWALDRWLQGFARHIPLEPGLFVAASLAALVVAWVTVLAHTLKVAGARPVGALRHE
jgi:putative ABC transport system permease protein